MAVSTIAPRQIRPLFFILTMTLLAACRPPGTEVDPPGDAVTGLPPFPANQPADWVCADSPPEPSPAQIAAWCDAHPDRGTPASLPVPPADITDLDAKNAFDFALRDFLRERTYRALKWIPDQQWRMTGPYVGDFPDGKSYGVHPAVRIWYSPEVVDWLCSDRSTTLKDGAMIIKEMHSDSDYQTLGIDPTAQCLTISAAPETIEPTSWTVMVRDNDASHDGWYWANPTASGDGNPPILSQSAVTYPDFFGPNPQAPDRNPRWYPTGDLFEDPAKPGSKLADIVTPYSEFGAYCLNCHASAESLSTYSSLANVMTEGLQFRHFSEAPAMRPLKRAEDDFAGSEHVELDLDTSERAALSEKQQQAWSFTQPLPEPAAGFAEFFGDLGPTEFSEAFQFRLPAETFDHHLSSAEGPGQFLTSDQCIGCHDATVSNASIPNMLITDPDTGNAINVSPYAEWRASPMGLAGRDPIFFSQLQSETNHLPMHQTCIENTCLHCHGVMGQRQFAIDTQKPDADCKSNIFAIPPPPEIPFGDPFSLTQVTQYQDDQGDPQYGALARDGISCAVCHHVDKTALGTENSYTGNWVAGPPDEVYGPYESVIEKPMQHALGITPTYGEQIKGSDMCGTCHNILLPVFNNDGSLHSVTAPNGQQVTSTYEQTTHLEWVNSDFAKQGSFESCQDCHMPNHYKDQSLAGTKIANIESNEFAPTTHRLPDADITLTPREEYARHALHGLNLFMNEMFQQFPLLLGVRQIDYMGSTTTQPALITTAESMTKMALEETADVIITQVDRSLDQGRVTVGVRVTNKVGHALPSGVGFRRVILELTMSDADGNLLWASGRTNALGVILDGISDTPLATENGINQTEYQPHYQRITSGSQAQIYQELIKDSDGYLTTAFLRRVDPVKDNRLRPRGYDPQVFLNNPSPYIQILGELEGEVKNDPYYSNPDLTGADVITYQASLSREAASQVSRIDVRLYSQSIPPFYLQERFRDATVGPAKSNEIQRLYYLTSHLNAGEGTRIENWKVLLAEAKLSLGGNRVTAP